MGKAGSMATWASHMATCWLCALEKEEPLAMDGHEKGRHHQFVKAE